MKILIIIFSLLISVNAFSQPSKQDFTLDSLNILKAKKVWVFKGSISTYPEPWVPWGRREKVKEYLKNISPNSRFYQDKLNLEKEIKNYFNEEFISDSSQQSNSAKPDQRDSIQIVRAKKEWENSYKSYDPERRIEYVNRELEKILPDSPFYPDRLELEQTIKDYFDTWQTIADERYSYYVNNLSGTKTYKGLLRKLVDFGFTQRDFFTKNGNLIYNYDLYEYDKIVKILVQVKINYASDISYEVYTYFY